MTHGLLISISYSVNLIPSAVSSSTMEHPFAWRMVLKLVRIQRRADGGWHNTAYVDTTKKGKRRDVGALIFGYPCESITRRYFGERAKSNGDVQWGRSWPCDVLCPSPCSVSHPLLHAPGCGSKAVAVPSQELLGAGEWKQAGGEKWYLAFSCLFLQSCP